MSGDLKNPSKAIPKGTLSGLALTFVTYGLVILAMAASVTRESFYNNVNVIQIVSHNLQKEWLHDLIESRSMPPMWSSSLENSQPLSSPP
jgi:amino acid transporter